MKSQDIIELASKLLNIQKDVIGDEQDAGVISLMTTALNNVISEIAEEYIPFIKSENAKCVDGQILYDTLSESVKEIIIVKKGSKVKFKPLHKGIKLNEDGEYEVTYSYIPKKIEFGDEIDFPAGVTERTVACGVAGEYALMCERYEECVNYDNKFLSGIKAVKRVKRERKLPYRGWN